MNKNQASHRAGLSVHLLGGVACSVKMQEELVSGAVWYQLSRQLAALPRCLLGRWEQEQHMQRTEADSRDEALSIL